MKQVDITIVRPRRWWRWRKTSVWRREIPESWTDVPDSRRLRFWSWAVTLPLAEATEQILREILHLPAWAWPLLDAEAKAKVSELLGWVAPKADAADMPLRKFEHRGTVYHFPSPQGDNVVCLEYPIADDFFGAAIEGKPGAATHLLATLCRENRNDHHATLLNDDPRQPLLSRADALDRAKRLQGVPTEIETAALLYFAGLKAFVLKVYGKWIFDMSDDEETDDDEDNPEPDPTPPPASRWPNFGWWGIFQDVAESGAFGPVPQVHQTSFHEVCIWLVRQRVKAEQMKESTSTTSRPTQRGDNYDD